MFIGPTIYIMNIIAYDSKFVPNKNTKNSFIMFFFLNLIIIMYNIMQTACVAIIFESSNNLVIINWSELCLRCCCYCCYCDIYSG